MIKKILKISGIVLVVAVLLLGGYLYYTKIRIDRGDLVKWNGAWFTKEQYLKYAFPQEKETPAKNNPEEVYEKFREALLKNDNETALLLIREPKRDEYRKAFQDKDKLDKWVKSLPEEITKEKDYGGLVYYDIDYGTEYKNTVTFIINKDGYFEIDSI